MKKLEIKELGYKFDMNLSFKGKSWEEIVKLKPENKKFITIEDVNFIMERNVNFIMERKELKITLGMDNTWEFIEPYWGYSVAWLDADSDMVILGCSRNPSSSGGGLGVRFKEDLR